MYELDSVIYHLPFLLPLKDQHNWVLTFMIRIQWPQASKSIFNINTNYFEDIYWCDKTIMDIQIHF